MVSKGSQTKENIIEKSLHLFSVKGYHHTSINDILTACGLTKGGLYGHFKSKEEIWSACYGRAVDIWKTLVFENVKEIKDPLERIEKALHNDLTRYLGGDVFEGGCFFLNMLVELSGQSEEMNRNVREGIMGFSNLIGQWLEEARDKKLLKPDIDVNEVSDFIVISINGCAALYASTHDPEFIRITLSQMGHYVRSLKN